MNQRSQLFGAIGWRKQGGLYVPQDWHSSAKTRVPEPILSFLRPAPGYFDIFGTRLSLDEILVRIRQLPRDYWLKFISAVMLVCDRDGYMDQTTNERFINTFVHADYNEALLSMIRDAGYGLFSPQTLPSLAKLALAYALDNVEHVPDDQLEHIFRTYLAVHDHVQSVVIPDANADPRAVLLRFFVQNSDFAIHSPLYESFIESWSLLCEQPRASGSQLLPEEIFVSGTGISLEHFLAMAFCITGSCYAVDVDSTDSMVQSIIINPEALFCLASIEAQEVERFFDRLTLTDDAVEQIKQEDPNMPSYFYDFSAFRERPLYKLSKNEFLPLIFPFLRARVTSGLYWDIWITAQKDKKYGNKVKEQFASAFGEHLEAYIRQIFREVVGSSSTLAKRIWDEPGKLKGLRNVDIVIKYSEAYVFIEVKGARLKYAKSMVHGDLAAIEDDMRQMVYEPLCQMSDAIDHFKAGNLADLGLEWHGEKILPVVITYGSLLYTTILDLAEGNDCYQKLAKAPGCTPPMILDVEEAMRLASLAKNGHSIINVLNQKQQSPYNNLSFRDFTLRVYGDASEPKHVLEGKWEMLSEIIKNSLFDKEGMDSRSSD